MSHLRRLTNVLETFGNPPDLQTWVVIDLLRRVLDHPITVQDTCGRSFLGTPLSAQKFRSILKSASMYDGGDTIDFTWFSIDDYEPDGVNPFFEEYVGSQAVDKSNYLVHYDNDAFQPNSLSLLWTACEPSDVHCGTHVCKRNVPIHHDASTPVYMTSDEVFSLPSETLVLINLYTTPHSPPSHKDFRQFDRRLFVSIEVPLSLLKRARRRPRSRKSSNKFPVRSAIKKTKGRSSKVSVPKKKNTHDPRNK